MRKLSWMKFYPADWVNDTRELSAEAKGCWTDMLCLMWNSRKRGRWHGTYQEFARATGIPWENAPKIVTELSKKTATVTICNADVTLINRRMVKQEKHYKLASNRQRRWRRNANRNAHITAKTSQESLRLLKNTQDPQTSTRAHFLKPTQEQVNEWATANSMDPFEAKKFFDHYESNGWRVGKNAMKNWHAAASLWNRRAKEFSPRNESMLAPMLPRYKETVPHESEIFDPLRDK